ncbi:MAG: LysM peptidoglycan-binding domain-containing protein [Puniceicoccales bacterium]|nr:LysM peptidoglycan-binding domain-containing protein [Puniceicoccales bacterium]
MVKRILWVLFMMSSTAIGGPKTKAISRQSENTMEDLIENMTVLRKDINDFKNDLHRLQREVECLKLHSNVLSETQEAQATKIAEEVYKRCDVAGVVDREVNALSLAFSREINALSEKISNVFNAIISTINAQWKLSNAITSSETKQPGGIAYEVKAGETLDSIATKFKTTREDIRKLNFITNENHLSAGLMLFIPQIKLDFSVK